MITLLKSYPWISGAGGQLITPWVAYPEQLGDCEMVVVVELLNSGSIDIQLETSTDGAFPITLGAPVTANAVGATSNVMDVVGTMVRLDIECTEAVLMTISIYLVPKQS